MAVAGDHRIDQLDTFADRRQPGSDGERSKHGNLPGDLDPCGASDAPASALVPDMHRVEQDLGGWCVDDLVGILEWH